MKALSSRRYSSRIRTEGRGAPCPSPQSAGPRRGGELRGRGGAGSPSVRAFRTGGSAISVPEWCPACGVELEPSTAKCPACGAEVATAGEPPHDFTRTKAPRPPLDGIARNCPRCGQPLESGFIATTAALWITWVKERGILDAAPWKSDKIVISDRIGTAHVPGLRCRTCGILTLDLHAAD